MGDLLVILFLTVSFAISRMVINGLARLKE